MAYDPLSPFQPAPVKGVQRLCVRCGLQQACDTAPICLPSGVYIPSKWGLYATGELLCGRCASGLYSDPGRLCPERDPQSSYFVSDRQFAETHRLAFLPQAPGGARWEVVERFKERQPGHYLAADSSGVFSQRIFARLDAQLAAARELHAADTHATLVEALARLEPQPPKPTEEETTMPEEESKMKHQARAIGAALAAGGQLALVDEGGDLLLDLARELAKDFPVLQILLADDDYREFAKLFVAGLLHTVETHTDLLGKAGPPIRKVCEMQMTVGGYKVIKPRLGTLRKYVLGLAEIGEKMDAGDVWGAMGALPQARVADEDIAEAELESGKASPLTAVGARPRPVRSGGEG